MNIKTSSDGISEIIGYSNETKPTQGMAPFSTFLELDTKAIYIFDGSLWKQF